MKVVLPMTLTQIAMCIVNGIDNLPETTEIDFYFDPNDSEKYGVKLMQIYNEEQGVITFGCYTNDLTRICTRACGVSNIIFDYDEDCMTKEIMIETIQAQLEVWMLINSNGKFKSEEQFVYVIHED